MCARKRTRESRGRRITIARARAMGSRCVSQQIAVLARSKLATNAASDNCNDVFIAHRCVTIPADDNAPIDIIYDACCVTNVGFIHVAAPPRSLEFYSYLRYLFARLNILSDKRYSRRSSMNYKYIPKIMTFWLSFVENFFPQKINSIYVIRLVIFYSVYIARTNTIGQIKKFIKSLERIQKLKIKIKSFKSLIYRSIMESILLHDWTPNIKLFRFFIKRHKFLL